MGRLKKQKPIISVRTLTGEDYINAEQIALRLKYPVNMDLMQILVPYNEMDNITDIASIKELQSKYKFSIQSTII